MGYNRNLVLAKKHLEAQQNSQWDGIAQCSQCLDKLGFGLKRKAKVFGCNFQSLRFQLIKHGVHVPKRIPWNKGLQSPYRDSNHVKPYVTKSATKALFTAALRRHRKSINSSSLFAKARGLTMGEYKKLRTRQKNQAKYYSNLDLSRQRGRLAAKKRYDVTKDDPLRVLKRSMRNTLTRIAREYGQPKGRKTIEYLGCTMLEAKAHIESLFKHGMTWQNHGEWEIDHIRELASFNLADPAQLLQANHYTNLQPLWKDEHKEKSIRYLQTRQTAINSHLVLAS